MVCSVPSPRRHLALAISTLVLVGAAQAQPADRGATPVDPPMLRQPTLRSVQKQEVAQNDATAADRKLREMDRRMNRTLRSICRGCSPQVGK